MSVSVTVYWNTPGLICVLARVAVAFSVMSSIWPKMPDMVLLMVSIMVRMFCIVAIIAGNWLSSCGMSASS